MKRVIPIAILIVVAFVLALLAFGNIFHLLPASTSNPNNTLKSPLIPQDTHVPPYTTITYDFNNGQPALFEGQNTPLNQTSSGLTTYFSSPSDPAAFSIQSYDTTFYILSQFSGNYLFDNKIVRDKLYISFSQPLTDISLTFATAEYYGAGHVDEPSTMKVTAYSYKNGVLTIIGSNTAKGIVTNNTFPQGILSFTTQQSFNFIEIEMLPQQPGGTDFLIDNIIVTTAP